MWSIGNEDIYTDRHWWWYFWLTKLQTIVLLGKLMLRLVSAIVSDELQRSCQYRTLVQNDIDSDYHTIILFSLDVSIWINLKRIELFPWNYYASSIGSKKGRNEYLHHFVFKSNGLLTNNVASCCLVKEWYEKRTANKERKKKRIILFSLKKQTDHWRNKSLILSNQLTVRNWSTTTKVFDCS